MTHRPNRPILSAKALRMRYGEGPGTVEALRDVSLEVEEGRLTAIMGPSGAGKSTLMRVLTGAARPSGGSVWLGEIEVTSLNERERITFHRHYVGFVPRSPDLMPTLTVEENILLPFSLAGGSPDPHWLESLLRRLEIAELRRASPGQLSAGEQQRVAIARALISRPTVLFADEPTSGLDSKAGKDLMRRLRADVDDYGQTTVLATHDAQAASFADHILFLVDGRIVKRLHHSTAAEVIAAMQELARSALLDPGTE